MSSLILKRETTVAVELRRRPFEIILDGKPAGTIARRQTVELEVGPGAHTLAVKAGRYSSPTQEFEAGPDTEIHFRCNGAILWPRYVASLFAPKLGLHLSRL